MFAAIMTDPIQNAEEPEEIAQCGGKMEVLFTAPNHLSLRYSHANPWGMSAFQMSFSLDGKFMQFIPLRGMDCRDPEPQSPVVTGFIISDREGYFGRSCPKCKTYFRINACREIIQCPYCACQAPYAAFTTKNQLQFLQKIGASYTEAFNQKCNVVLDLDKVASELPENRPSWIYSENRQQNPFTCSECKTRYDILGEYAGCPCCGKRNSLQVFERHIAQVEKDLNESLASITNPTERKVKWANLTICISDFEAMGRDIQAQLLLLPATPKRKKAVKELSFQNILKADGCLNEWYGFEILHGVPDEDRIFLGRMFGRRHLFTHNGGRVDQEYLDKTQDNTVKLYETISVRSKEIVRLIRLLRVVSQKLFDGFDSIA